MVRSRDSGRLSTRSAIAVDLAVLLILDAIHAIIAIFLVNLRSSLPLRFLRRLRWRLLITLISILRSLALASRLRRLGSFGRTTSTDIERLIAFLQLLDLVLDAAVCTFYMAPC